MSQTKKSQMSRLEKLYFEREAMIEILQEAGIDDWKSKVESYLNSVDRNDENHKQALTSMRDEISKGPRTSSN